ncbi:MAG: hypothetical protein ACOC4G_15210 [Bacillota bacterium]
MEYTKINNSINTVPIVGCRNISQLEASLMACDKKLPPEILQSLEELSGSEIYHR